MPWLPSRSGAIACIPLPLVIVSRIRATSAASCGRCCGSFARQCITKSASGAGVSSRSAATGRGGSLMCAASIRCGVRSGKTTWPVSSSKPIAPSE
jgi:hypothetical protein